MAATTIDKLNQGNITKEFVLRQMANHVDSIEHGKGRGIAPRLRTGDLYEDLDRTKGINLSFYVKEKNWMSRVDVLEELLHDVFKGISSHVTAGSSIGNVIVGTQTFGRYIRIALRRHGQASAGIGNEDVLVKAINYHTNGAGPEGMTIKFVPTKGKIFIANNIVKAVGVGTQRKKQVDDDKAPEMFPKSDVDLIDKKGNAIPVSIKQADAEFWASVETWFYPNRGRTKGGDWYMEKAQEAGLIDIVERPYQKGYFNLVHKDSTNLPDKKVQLVWKADKKMKAIAAFGNDIQKKTPSGLIVKKTFKTREIKLVDGGEGDESQWLEVQTDKNIVEVSELGDDVYLICYYSKTRGQKSKVARGTRITVATKSRAIGSGRNRVIIRKVGNTVERVAGLSFPAVKGT